MKSIKTPAGLKGYYPYNGNLKELKTEHPEIRLYKQATRKSDGVKFRAGQWVKLKGGEEVKVLAFDHYNYPLPINKKNKPVAQYQSGRILTTVYKCKVIKMIRAIYASGGGFTFHDIEEYKGIKQ